jgi:hypothetical protein
MSITLNEAQTAYVLAQTALLNCERAGMDAENTHRLSVGQSIAYGDEAFQALYDRYAPTIGTNAIMEMARANS